MFQASSTAMALPKMLDCRLRIALETFSLGAHEDVKARLSSPWK
jgi:hypothetical protein